MSTFAGYGVVVTGAGLGIGYDICQAFAAAGATVALNDLDGDRAAAAAAAINDAVDGTRVTAYGGDVADVPVVRSLIDAFCAAHGRLDVVVANAGLTNYGPFLSYSPEAFDRLTAVNLRGAYFTAQAAARAMIRLATGRGRIILMASVTGVRAHENLSAYGVTKAGILHMARTLAAELARYAITVNAVAPGAIVTERTVADDPDYAANWATVTPTGRAGHVDDVTAAVQLLSRPEADHITGQALVVDGGWTLRSPTPADHPEMPPGAAPR